MMAEATTIYVHGAQHKFDPHDDIFFLTMTNYDPLFKVKEDFEANCYSCEIPFKKGSALKKDIQVCEFCAMQVCKDCNTRRRQFPKSIELENGSLLYGKICRVCDRKFLMLNFYNKKIKPVYCGEADLRMTVQKYEMKLQDANFSIKEEQRYHELLQNTMNDNRLKMMRTDQSRD